MPATQTIFPPPHPPAFRCRGENSRDARKSPLRDLPCVHTPFVVSALALREGEVEGTVPTKRSLLSWLSALDCLALAVPAYSASPRSIVTTVQRVADGDTIKGISANGTKLRIRLLGIDASESAYEARPHVVGGEDCGIC
jgi:hypothetical protein